MVSGLNLRDDKGQPQTPEAASLALQLARIAKPKDIKAKGQIEFVTRHVLVGADTYGESDDKVQFITNVGAATPQDYILVRSREMELPRWNVVMSADVTSSLGVMVGTECKAAVLR